MKHMIFIIASAVISTLFSINISTRTITGTVTDNGGHPLIGANVIAKGSTKGTVTDFDGRYSIELQDSDSVLVVSYIGYATTEIKIGDEDTINIVMQEGVELGEVVVSSESIKRENKALGYSTTLIGADASGIHPRSSYVPSRKQSNNIQDNVIHNTEDYGLIDENKFHDPGTNPLSTFSIDTDGASYSNLRRFLSYGQAPPIDAIRIEEMINYFDYEYDFPQNEVPFAINTEVGICPWNEEHKLVHIGLQGKKIATENLPASNLVFLLDVSGSMNSANKLPLVVESFKLLTGQLREKDRVAIVVYAGSSGVVLPSTSGADKNKIIGTLSELTAGGSTAGASGIQLAYKIARDNFIEGGNNRVILATDGDFNVGQSSDAQLVRIIEKERESGVFLSVLGYGMGNYKDNKMQELADHGNGNHNYIDDISEAKKVFIHEFGGTLFTIAKDVKIQVEFNPEEVAGYRLIGYENRMLEAEDFNDDKKDAGEIGSGHTVTALYEIIPEGVKSEFLKSVDPLKYQKTSKVTSSAAKSGELMFVKIRYKSPQGSKSMLVDESVETAASTISATSDNFRWSAAVASFGMLLRNSEFQGESTLELVDALAKGAMDDDPFGYRSEFLSMVNGVTIDRKGMVEVGEGIVRD